MDETQLQQAVQAYSDLLADANHHRALDAVKLAGLAEQVRQRDERIAELESLVPPEGVS